MIRPRHKADSLTGRHVLAHLVRPLLLVSASVGLGVVARIVWANIISIDFSSNAGNDAVLLLVLLMELVACIVTVYLLLKRGLGG
jgi:hypothetical protein